MLISNDEMDTELGLIHGEADYNLLTLRDFHVFTGHCYGEYYKQVTGGYIKGVVHNGRTGTNLDTKCVADYAMEYLDDELPRVVLYQTVSHFEAFIFDLLRLLFLNNPFAMKSEQTLTANEILEKRNWENLTRGLIENKLHGLQYKNVRDWFTVLDGILKSPPVSKQDIERLAELKASRDLVAHNQGRVNETYIRKAGALARAKIGELIPITRPYVYEAGDFLSDLIKRIMAEVRKMFPQHNAVPTE